jgi:hypothetical protein
VVNDRHILRWDFAVVIDFHQGALN